MTTQLTNQAVAELTVKLTDLWRAADLELKKHGDTSAEWFVYVDNRAARRRLDQAAPGWSWEIREQVMEDKWEQNGKTKFAYRTIGRLVLADRHLDGVAVCEMYDRSNAAKGSDSSALVHAVGKVTGVAQAQLDNMGRDDKVLLKWVADAADARTDVNLRSLWRACKALSQALGDNTKTDERYSDEEARLPVITRALAAIGHDWHAAATPAEMRAAYGALAAAAFDARQGHSVLLEAQRTPADPADIPAAAITNPHPAN